MRLTELHPRWVGAGGDGVYSAVNNEPVPPRHGVGITFDCPSPGHNGRHYVPFSNPLDGGPAYNDNRALWQRTGDTFETLQLSPSIYSDPVKGGCGWHGYIGLSIPGEVTTC